MMQDGTEATIRARSLRKRYGSTQALAGLDLAVPKGAFYVLVGPNGAGKTTLLKTLLGLVRADEGAAVVAGVDPRADEAGVRAQVGYVPEGQAVPYAWLPVERLLRYHASYYPTWDAEYVERLSRFLEIRPAMRYGKLSKGQQRRVQILLALAHRPRVLILDEPTDGLDPVMRERVQVLLADHLSDFPSTVLLSTHVVHEMEQLADRMGIMLSGRLEADLERDELRRSVRRYRVQVPDDWAGATGLNGRVLRRAQAGREVVWTVWGEEEEITRALASTGATVREVSPLSLEEAALAFLSARQEEAR